MATKKELEEENSRLRRALEFYGDIHNWNPYKQGPGNYCIMTSPTRLDSDSGKLARQALKGNDPELFACVQCGNDTPFTFGNYWGNVDERQGWCSSCAAKYDKRGVYQPHRQYDTELAVENNRAIA